MKRVCLALLVSVLPWSVEAASVVNWAKELQVAQKALSSGQPAKAYVLFRQKAAANPLAQFMVGQFHLSGDGVEKNPVIACSWFEKAASRRIPAAEHQWGECLAKGIGRAADVPAALAWYEKAAGHGHLISACYAADYYIRGEGVPQDVSKGLSMCAEVASAHSPPAMLQLARYYREGRHLAQDLAAARQWYRKAAELGVAEAQFHLGVMLAQGEGGEPNPAEALYMLESAASTGYAPAYLPTAILYANAPVQPDTGALAPEHLAKVYLWNSAAKARNRSQDERAVIDRIADLVDRMMPETWRPTLDKQVADHLARYPAEAAASPHP